jgi:hypothetical protein
MKKRLLKPSPLFLKKSLKKNRTAFFIFLFFVPLQTFCETSQIFSIEYSLNRIFIERIQEVVHQGPAVEVIIQTRLYKKSESLFPFPDRQICRTDYSKTLSKDIFSNLFVIEEETGSKSYFNQFQKAVESFIHIETEISPQCELNFESSQYYLKKRAILKLKVYNEPFGIFQFIDKDSRIVTNWKKDLLPQ